MLTALAIHVILILVSGGSTGIVLESYFVTLSILFLRFFFRRKKTLNRSFKTLSSTLILDAVFCVIIRTMAMIRLDTRHDTLRLAKAIMHASWLRDIPWNKQSPHQRKQWLVQARGILNALEIEI